MGKWGRSRRSPCHMTWKSRTARPQMCWQVWQWGQGASAGAGELGRGTELGCEQERRQRGVRACTRTGCGCGSGESGRQWFTGRGAELSQSPSPGRFSRTETALGAEAGVQTSASGIWRQPWPSGLHRTDLPCHGRCPCVSVPEDTGHADQGPAPGDLILITSARALFPNR